MGIYGGLTQGLAPLCTAFYGKAVAARTKQVCPFISVSHANSGSLPHEATRGLQVPVGMMKMRLVEDIPMNDFQEKGECVVYIQ
jgi:hypothetical protein